MRYINSSEAGRSIVIVTVCVKTKVNHVITQNESNRFFVPLCVEIYYSDRSQTSKEIHKSHMSYLLYLGLLYLLLISDFIG
jgi:hypothetical protein